MDFAKDEIFSIKYKGENERSKRLKKFISKHKFILTLSIIGLATFSIYCVLIYNFVNILNTL